MFLVTPGVFPPEQVKSVCCEKGLFGLTVQDVIAVIWFFTVMKYRAETQQVSVSVDGWALSLSLTFMRIPVISVTRAQHFNLKKNTLALLMSKISLSKPWLTLLLRHTATPKTKSVCLIVVTSLDLNLNLCFFSSLHLLCGILLCWGQTFT